MNKQLRDLLKHSNSKVRIGGRFVVAKKDAPRPRREEPQARSQPIRVSGARRVICEAGPEWEKDR